MRRNIQIVFDEKVWIYLTVSMVAAILIMAIPAIRHSKVSIVNLKQIEAKKKRPLLYISSSLFIVGAGLLYLRLQPYLIKLIYMVGQRFWRPAGYASFLEIIKNGRKQQFIMLFLIITIALGTYHATVARTILQNAKENLEYVDAADVIIKEVWRDNSQMLENAADYDEPVKFRYYVPDYEKYSQLKGVKSYTKVVNIDNCAVYGSKMQEDMDVQLMGIHTREFGENTFLKSALLDDYYYNYLNQLAAEPSGVIVSESFRTQLGYNVGDTLAYTYVVSREWGLSFTIMGKILGFVEYWPGYVPTVFCFGIGDGRVPVGADCHCVQIECDESIEVG